MSLKAFHIFFITLSVLLSAGCSVWAFRAGTMQVFAIASAVVAVALLVYASVFVKKARGIIT